MFRPARFKACKRTQLHVVCDGVGSIYLITNMFSRFLVFWHIPHGTPCITELRGCNEWWIGKDQEGSGVGLLRLPSDNFPEGTYEDQCKLKVAGVGADFRKSYFPHTTAGGSATLNVGIWLYSRWYRLLPQRCKGLKINALSCSSWL